MLKRRLEFAGLANKALHQTRRGGVALRSPGPVVEARLAGEGRCWADHHVADIPVEPYCQTAARAGAR